MSTDYNIKLSDGAHWSGKFAFAGFNMNLQFIFQEE